MAFKKNTTKKQNIPTKAIYFTTPRQLLAPLQKPLFAIDFRGFKVAFKSRLFPFIIKQ
jgi:hypothetical protein